MSPCRPAPAKPGRRRQPPPNPPENAAAAPDVVPRQPEFRQNANIISYLKNSGVQVGSDILQDPPSRSWRRPAVTPSPTSKFGETKLFCINGIGVFVVT